MSKEIEPKTSQNELKNDIEKLQKLQKCEHCKNNAQATRPFSEMKKLPLTSLAKKIIYKVAEEYDIEPGCLICLTIENFKKLPNDAQRLEWLKRKN